MYITFFLHVSITSLTSLECANSMLTKTQVPWPLHLIVSQMDLELYNALFCFLFTTKRVGTALDRAWIHLNETRYRVSGGVWNRDRCRLSASVSSVRSFQSVSQSVTLALILI